MSLLSSKYYIFLKKHTLDFDSILNGLLINNINLKNWTLQYDFINCQLQDLLELYPKFLTYSNLIDFSINLYNQNKIISSTTMSVEQLKTSIVDDKCYILSNNIRNFPNNYDDLYKEHIFQNDYFSNFCDIYNKNLFIYNHETSEYTKNFSGLLNDTYDVILNTFQQSILERVSFFHLYFLKSLMNNYFSEKSTLNNNLINNLSLLDFSVDLAAVVDKNILNTTDNIITNFTDVVLINQYSFTDVSTDFKEKLTLNTTIQDKILSIVTIFNDYLETRSTELKETYVQKCSDMLNHSFSFNFINNIFNLKSIFDFKGLNSLSYNLYTVSELSEFENLQIQPEGYASTLYEFEQQILSYYQTSLNDAYSLKQYFYLLYLNRNQIEKFINIIDLVSSTYVADNIKLSDVYYFNKFSHLKNLFIDWSTYIYYNTFQKALTREYTAIKQQSFLDQNNNIVTFSFVCEMFSVIEDFINTDEFTDYLRDAQLEIYNQLRTLGYIEPNIDWCSCDLPLKVCLKSLLKTFVLDSDFFDIADTIDYMKGQMTNSEYNIDTEENFNIFKTNFIDTNATAMFEFYQSFITSLNGSIFSRAVHSLYKL